MIDFPSAPTIGDIHTDGAISWRWDGEHWAANTASNGDVTGPASATTGHLATYADGTGKLLADGAIAASAVIVSGGALGTPASGSAANLTNIPLGAGTGVVGATHGGAGTVTGLLKADGAGNVSAATAGTDYAATSGAGLPFNLLLPITGPMTATELLVPPTIIPACSFPSGAAGSSATSTVAATGSATITVKKNGSSFATFAWSAAGTVAAVTISSTTGFNGTSDKLSIEAPGSVDATLANIGLHLAGTRA